MKIENVSCCKRMIGDLRSLIKEKEMLEKLKEEVYKANMDSSEIRTGYFYMGKCQWH